MSNKRNLKKSIKYACGNVAGECVYASLRLEGIDEEKIENIVCQVAMLQVTAVDKVTARFDKTRKDFADEKAYRKARRAYFKEYYAGVEKEFASSIDNIVKQMNDMLTPEQKEANKEAAAE